MQHESEPAARSEREPAQIGSSLASRHSRRIRASLLAWPQQSRRSSTRSVQLLGAVQPYPAHRAGPRQAGNISLSTSSLDAHRSRRSRRVHARSKQAGQSSAVLGVARQVRTPKLGVSATLLQPWCESKRRKRNTAAARVHCSSESVSILFRRLLWSSQLPPTFVCMPYLCAPPCTSTLLLQPHRAKR